MYAVRADRHPAALLRVAAVLLLLGAVPAWAQEAMLTTTQVRATIDAIRDLRSAFGASIGESGAVEQFEPGHADYQRAMGILKDHGFETPDAWAQTSQRVMSAYVTVKMAANQPEVDGEMRRAISEVENNPNLSPEQKQQMRQVIEQSLASLRTLGSASPADQAAVQPFLAEIDAFAGR